MTLVSLTLFSAKKKNLLSFQVFFSSRSMRMSTHWYSTLKKKTTNVSRKKVALKIHDDLVLVVAAVVVVSVLVYRIM